MMQARDDGGDVEVTMSNSPFRCDTPTRRALLTGLGVGAPLAMLMASKPHAFDRRAPNGLLEVGDLVDANGAPTALAIARSGENVSIRGFYAPAMRPGALFDLYQGATGPCLACGLIHDPGASLAVTGTVSPVAPSALARMEIAGRLTVGARGVGVAV